MDELKQALAELDPQAIFAETVEVAALVGFATVVYFVVRALLVRASHRLAETTTTHWDDELVAAGVFARLAHIAPAFVVYYGVGFFPDLPEVLSEGIRRLAIAVMIVGGALGTSSFLQAADAIYNSHPEYRERPIKGYLQVVSIAVYLLAGLLVLAALMNKSPWIFLSGIGAMTAVVLLIFRDTILSLVASVQIASNDLIRVGDWIEMPDLGADGDVIEVALHTVKVQNWDKTITTIPTHRLISDSFKNWRGMSRAGARRIKRSVNVDLETVRFLDEEEIDRFAGWALLSDYIREKREEIARANEQAAVDPAVPENLRRLTNLGTFRAWIQATLRSHPQVHQTGQTLLVRQLAPGPQGVPIEVYCFSKETSWVEYEGIQSDLFDRILAIVPAFGLRVFQEPTGADLRRFMETRGGGRAMATDPLATEGTS
jgi:miniconductance mechanosensitive channel